MPGPVRFVGAGGHEIARDADEVGPVGPRDVRDPLDDLRLGLGVSDHNEVERLAAFHGSLEAHQLGLERAALAVVGDHLVVVDLAGLKPVDLERMDPGAGIVTDLFELARRGAEPNRDRGFDRDLAHDPHRVLRREAEERFDGPGKGPLAERGKFGQHADPLELRQHIGLPRGHGRDDCLADASVEGVGLVQILVRTDDQGNPRIVQDVAGLLRGLRVELAVDVEAGPGAVVDPCDVVPAAEFDWGPPIEIGDPSVAVVGALCGEAEGERITVVAEHPPVLPAAVVADGRDQPAPFRGFVDPNPCGQCHFALGEVGNLVQG